MPGRDGHINLVAYNESTLTAPVLISQYIGTQPIVIDKIAADDRSIKVTSTDSGVEARFSDVPPGKRISVGVDYHYAQTRPVIVADGGFGDLTPDTAAEMAHRLDNGEPISPQ